VLSQLRVQACIEKTLIDTQVVETKDIEMASKKKEDSSRPVNAFTQMMSSYKYKKKEADLAPVNTFAQMMSASKKRKGEESPKIMKEENSPVTASKQKKGQIIEGLTSIGEVVSVKWIDGSVYKGTIVKDGKQGYFVHYKGWSNKWDEWVDGPEKISVSKENIKKEKENVTPKNPSKRRKVLGEIKNINNCEASESPEPEPKRKKRVLAVVKTESKAEIKKKEIVGHLEMNELSEYEKIRLANIKEREDMFKQLEIGEAKSRLSDAFTPSQNKNAISRRGLATEKREKEILPPRKSLRQRNIDADTGLTLPEEKFINQVHQREDYDTGLPFETLVCKETCKGTAEESSDYLNKIMSSIKIENTSKSASFGGDEDECLKRLSNITINEERVAKVVKERIFSVAIHPMEDKVLAAAGGKLGGIGLWDVNDLEGANNGVQLWNPHSRPVNSLTWDKFNPSRLISTSYDGTLRGLDVEKQEHALLYGDEDSMGHTTYHSQVGPTTFLVSQGATGIVGMVDTRVNNSKMVEEYQVFDRISPKTVDVHPTQDNYFVCANNKAGCFIFDIRKTGKKLMTPVVELLGHTRALSSAMFSPISGNKVATVAYDDKVRVYDTSKLTGTVLPSSQVKHNNQTGRWLTTFKVSWHPKMDDLLFMGSMERPRQIEAFRVGDQGIKMVKALKGEDLGSVCSVVAAHPTLDVVIGGNSSGRVFVFM